jgi:hypothetical protein
MQRRPRASAPVRVTGGVDQQALCDARSMTDKPRYRLRANSVAMTRFQWWIAGLATAIGVFGLILILAGRFPLGILFLCLSGMTNGLTVLIASHRSRST